MNTLVVFYSRKGNTKKAGEEIAKALGCDSEEIFDTKKRTGFLNYLPAGRDAKKKKLTVLVEPKKDPSQYDLVVIGTPIWAGLMSVPVRTYINLKKDALKKVAFFSTGGGGENTGLFSDMGEACGNSPVATLGLKTKDVNKGQIADKIKEFAGKLKS
jgi:flavodoxin